MDWKPESLAQRFVPLLSMKGRTSRLGYWRVGLLLTLMMCVVFTVVVFATMLVGRLAAPLALLALPLFWMNLAVSIRRLHDRGKSGWWYLLFFGPIYLTAALSGAEGMSAGAALLALPAMALEVWGVVEIGFVRGQDRTNGHGAPPPAGA